MSTDEARPLLEPILTARQRCTPITLPIDPSEEELARDWTLSDADKAEVLRCRGDGHRRSFAVQLCVLRRYGRFLTEYEAIPARITNHLGRQLDLPPVLFLEPPHREATDLEHERRIRDHLGFRAFDRTAQEGLERWVQERALQGLPDTEILDRAEDLLRSWKVVLPAPSTLERIVASITTRARHEVFGRIAGRLTPGFCQAIDDLLQVPEGEQRSRLFRLKEYPSGANVAEITLHIESYHLLRGLGVGQIDWTGISPDWARHLAQLAGRYDAGALKRFAPTKRHALVACLLAEAQKTVLDHVSASIRAARRSRNPGSRAGPRSNTSPPRRS